MDWILYLCLFFRLFLGALGVEMVFVRRGDSVVLHTDLTELQPEVILQWTFGSIIIAGLPEPSVIFNNNGLEKGLLLDSQTGSLTILRVDTVHAGLYTVEIVIPRLDLMEPIFETVLHKSFNIVISDPLSTPVITSQNSPNCSSSSSSSSSCVLLCSVLNVSHVTLSWYKGNSLHSTVSLSDPIPPTPSPPEDENIRKRSYDVMANPARVNTSLSLPLEVEYHDTNTYSCVVFNSTSNQTEHLHMKQLCPKCSGPTTLLYLLALIPVVLGLILVGIYLCWKYGKGKQEGMCCKSSHGVLKWCSVNSPLINCS